MNNHVVTKETAILLRDAGFPQETYFFWYLSLQPDLIGLIHFDFHDTSRVNDYRTESTKSLKREYVYYAAPIAEEILNLLPEDVIFPTTKYLLQIGHGIDEKWQIDYRDVNDGQLNAFLDNNLAEAAAKMYIYLKQSNLI